MFQMSRKNKKLTNTNIYVPNYLWQMLVFIGEKDFIVKGIRIHNNKEEVIDRLDNLVLLEREPENDDDSNAIEVFMKDDRQKIGYIARDDAAILAPIFDKNMTGVKKMTHKTRLIDVCDSMTATVRVKFYYIRDEQGGNSYDELIQALDL